MLRRPAVVAVRVAAARRAALCTAAAQEGTTTRRLGAAFFSGVVGTTGCLTAWQLQRYDWKVKLVEERGAALEREPQPWRDVVLNPSNGIDTADEYARVTCEGEFDHSQQVLLGPRSAPPATTSGGSGAPPGAPTQSGWDVLTPLACTDGSRIIVNRGWVPRDATNTIDQPHGMQRLSGVLRHGDRENKYGVNDLEARRLVWLDLCSLASATGSNPVLVVATEPIASGIAETPRARAIAFPLPGYLL